MKSILPLTAAIAFVAFLALPFSAEISGSIAIAASLASLLVADYGRRASTSVAANANRRSTESYRLAA